MSNKLTFKALYPFQEAITGYKVVKNLYVSQPYTFIHLH